MQRGSDSAAETVAQRVIGAAIEVHRELGVGCERPAYAEALAIELHLHQLDFKRNPEVAIHYKGHAVGACRTDFLVGGCVAVELETDSARLEVDSDRLRHFLVAAKVHLGLVINFHALVIKNGIRRVGPL